MKLLFILLIVVPIQMKVYNQKNEKITIVGEAFNVKEGACVSTKDGAYHVDSLSEWSKKYLGKKVLVSGFLYFKTTVVDSNKPPVQNISRTKKIIKNAKWKLYQSN